MFGGRISFHSVRPMNGQRRRPGRQPGDSRGAAPGGRFGWSLAAVAAVATLAVVIPPLPAAVALAGGNGQFGLTPAPASNGQTTPYFSLTVAAGGSAAATVVVSNQGNTTEKLKLSPSTGITAANGGSAFSQSFQSCSGPGCWVTGLPDTVTLPVDTVEDLQFGVHVPRGTPPRQYLAGITAELAAGPRSVQVGTNGRATARAIIIDQVTVGVLVNVGSLSRLTWRLRIPDVSGAAFGRTARLNIVQDNTGQRFTRASGTASCTAAGQRHTYAVLAATVLPGDRAVIAVNAPGLPEGSALPCTVRVGYGNGLTASWAGSVTVPAPPRVRIIHTGLGAYSVIPSAGISPWMIALFVVAGLALIVVSVLLVQLRRRRQPS